MNHLSLIQVEKKAVESRRKFQRYGCFIPVSCVNGHRYTGHMKDVSSGGSFIIPAYLQPGQEVTVIFESPSKNWSISFHGTVVRTTLEGMGIAFFSPLSEKVPLWLLEMDGSRQADPVPMT